ncbi:MAG: glycosyltransferase family 4 protein [Bacteroidota bacterium]|nr:glycosyltransferase family 4 protein [Bacteroidota bacterium]
MKILFITPYLPHPKSGHGTGVFTYGVLYHLCSKHDITLLSFCDEKELVLLKDLDNLPIKKHIIAREKGRQKGIFRNQYLLLRRSFQLFLSIVLWEPYYVSKYRSAQMKQMINKLTEENSYDIVQIEMSQMGQYINSIKSGKTILHEHDVAYRPAFRQYKKSRLSIKKLILFIEWCRWAKYESMIVKKFHHILSVTRQDQLLLEWLSGMKHISYFPRGVDIPASTTNPENRNPNTVVFIGNFSHRPNLDSAFWLVEEIFPLVLKNIPSASLLIIGPNPPENLKTASIKTKNTHILGFVKDISQYLQQCSVFAAPLRYGGGVKIKILHAMAEGIPIVTTKVGAEGIDGINPNSILIGNSSREIANHICKILTDLTYSAVLSNNEQEIINKYYSWEVVMSKLEIIYENIINK